MENFIIQNDILVKYIGKDELVIVPEGVTSIGNSAFRDCGLRRIKLPDTLYAIAKSSFQSCSALDKITIPFSVKKIEKNAFANCKSLQSIEFSDPILLDDSEKSPPLSQLVFRPFSLNVYFEKGQKCMELVQEDGTRVKYVYEKDGGRPPVFKEKIDPTRTPSDPPELEAEKA